MHLLWGRGWRTPGWSPILRLLARICVAAGGQLVVDGSPDLFLSATLGKAELQSNRRQIAVADVQW